MIFDVKNSQCRFLIEFRSSLVLLEKRILYLNSLYDLVVISQNMHLGAARVKMYNR